MIMKMLCFHIHSSDTMKYSSLIDEGEYDYELHAFYHLDECYNIVKGYKNIDSNMWRNMIHWLIETHWRLQTLSQQTLFLCVNILQRFLSITNHILDFNKDKKKFQLVVLTSLMLASKYEEEESPLCVYDLEYMTEFSCSIQEICEMELVILQNLDWVLTLPTPYVFIHMNMRVSLESHDEDKIMEKMVFFISELGLTHYSIVGFHKPSLIAASAVYAARIVLGKTPYWNKILKNYTGYSKNKLDCCTKLMLQLCISYHREGHNHVLKEFSSVICVVLQHFSNRSDLRTLMNKSLGQQNLIMNSNVGHRNRGLFGC
ncbi:hypothetical protein Lal_00009287 [Lupinus albus]|uniref:B-like cyclin n=1 Tax=Lupinus albus TaxID=3870 RepID=A0A6A4P172_LUPAL|nr:putative cyclin [Lupinus albus]KAF1862907.1 hypothetical protein Lal_00009287 [Lupinus albus]